MAVVFGVATVLSGERVAGSDPVFVVFGSLLIYSTSMGLAYLAAGVMMWRSVDRGKLAAGTIFAFNLVALAGVGYLYAIGTTVTVDNLRAMTFRTVVWLGLFLGMLWLSRRHHTEGVGTDPG